MNAFIVYDLTNKQSEVKVELKKMGYHDKCKYKNQTYYLPNTSLWKVGISLADAKQEFLNVIELLNLDLPIKEKITVKRLIVLSVNPFDGITGSDDRP